MQEAIERLPAGQKATIILRDIENRTSEEACELLGVSAENQRVLLHRARARVREALDAVVGKPMTRTATARPMTRKAAGGLSLIWARLLAWAAYSPRKCFAAAS